MSRVSPTQRTLAAYRKRGYRAQVVERWVAQAMKRIDLFGFIDGIALSVNSSAPAIIGWQATDRAHLADHLYKIQVECREAARDWLIAEGRIEVWAWRCLSPRGTKLVRWKPIVVGLTLGDKGQIVESYRES